MNGITIIIKIALLKFDPDQTLRQWISTTLSERDQELWQTLGPAPKREFPNFEDAAAEIAKIKKTLRAKAAGHGGHLHFKSDQRPKGMVLLPDYPTAGPVPDHDPRRRDTINLNEIESETNAGLMDPYLHQALLTQKGQATDRGVPHDYHTETGQHQSVPPNAWLPGLFVIDEIWQALLSTVDDKIRAVNSAVVRLQSLSQGNQNPGERKAKELAVARLEGFAAAITQNNAALDTSGEAAKYLPFINHHLAPEDPQKVPEKTYIRLVKVEEFILGAIVSVGDWAAGSHSSGSAIH